MSGLADFIKKKPAVAPTPVTPKTPYVSALAQTPQEINTSAIPPTEVGESTRVGQMANQDGIRKVPEVPLPPVTQRVEAGEDPFEALLKQNYEESEKDLKRHQKAALLGDLAQVFGQTAALAGGARQFAPIKSSADQYINALANLKQNFNRDRMNYTLSNIKAERDAKIQQQKLAFEFDRDRTMAQIKAALEAGLIDRRHANALEEQTRKAKDAQELAKINNAASMDRTVYNAGQAMARTNKNNQTRLDVAEKTGKGKGSSSSKRSIRLKNADGSYQVVEYDKEMEGAILSLYDDMQDIINNAPEGKYDDLEDLNIKLGEGGDVASKAMTIIARRIQDFPELNPKFLDIVKSKNKKDNDNDQLDW